MGENLWEHLGDSEGIAKKPFTTGMGYKLSEKDTLLIAFITTLYEAVVDILPHAPISIMQFNKREIIKPWNIIRNKSSPEKNHRTTYTLGTGNNI